MTFGPVPRHLLQRVDHQLGDLVDGVPLLIRRRGVDGVLGGHGGATLALNSCAAVGPRGRWRGRHHALEAVQEEVGSGGRSRYLSRAVWGLGVARLGKGVLGCGTRAPLKRQPALFGVGLDVAFPLKEEKGG